MIDVAGVLQAVPGFETFCSVEKLHNLVETLRADSNFQIKIAGTSVNGIPIHHVRFGKGSVKALVVAFPHCSEPIGSLTVFSLLTLLARGNRELTEADVEWHIVPCIDPDGALLNEGWTQQLFTLANHMRHFYKQQLRDQAECSFPIHHNRLVFDRPTKEARVLQGLLEEIRPDFYSSLHNGVMGGAYFLISRDIGGKYYRQLKELLERQRIPLQESPPRLEGGASFAPGICEPIATWKYYDQLEKTTPCPEQVLNFGANSWDYLAQIKESALTFVSELPHVRHPSDGSQQATSQNLRQLKLRLDADKKFVVTVILEEWDKVKGDLDAASPFYKKVLEGMVAVKDRLHEGLPWWPDKTRDILFNPVYSRTMTEGERFNEYFRRFYLLCNCHEFVRLLKASAQTPAVKQATQRLETVFDEAMDDIAGQIGFEKFEVFDCDTLGRVQLGSLLIGLNSLLEKQARVQPGL